MNDTLEIKNYDNREDFKLSFNKIAKLILNFTELKTKKSAFLIREIEFYYHSPNHTDFYCHKNERQLTNSRLYFHRFKDPETYLKLRRKGIDITFGGNKKNYGGILIRAIENIETKEIYTGIGKITNLIIDEIGGIPVIQELYKSDKNVFQPNSVLYLEQSADNNLKIFKKNRQGINIKNEDTEGFYLNSKYNYSTYPEIEEVI